VAAAWSDSGARRSLGRVSRLSSIVARTYEVFNTRDFDAYRELLDEHVELVMSGIAVRGLAAVTDFVAVTARARPGLRLESPRVFVEAATCS
jgi:SnoaL-like domain